jgi:acetyltransferase-like isoleucine patch superfamily enzyme
MNKSRQMLDQVCQLMDAGPDTAAMQQLLALIGAPHYDDGILEESLLWTDYLPMIDSMPYTREQRYLHMLWEIIDRVPLGLFVSFAIPFRCLIAERLFKKVGKNFIAHESCRFNFGNLLEIGDNVAMNQGVFLDSKGGLEVGDYSMFGEFARVFTHNHSESDHMQRTYKKVKIGKYCKIYTAATIFPGVTIGDYAIVSAGSIVTHDVPAGAVVSGIPARVTRERRSEGNSSQQFNHFALKDKSFQED